MRKRFMAFLATIVTAAVMTSGTHAALLYTVTVNTSSLGESSAVLIFDFIDGDLVANNHVDIVAFSADGATLGAAFLTLPDPSLPSFTTTLSSLPRTLSDAGGFSTYEQEILFGEPPTSLQFSFFITTNEVADPILSPDSFVFSILSDPLLSVDGALLRFSIGSEVLELFGDAGVIRVTTREVAVVPEPTTLALLACGILLLGSRGSRQFLHRS